MESASIRVSVAISATAAAVFRNGQMIVGGGSGLFFFVIVIVFYLIFKGGEQGKIATKANIPAIESLLSSHRSAGWMKVIGGELQAFFLLYTAINR